MAVARAADIPLRVEGILRWHPPAHDSIQEGLSLSCIEPQHLKQNISPSCKSGLTLHMGNHNSCYFFKLSFDLEHESRSQKPISGHLSVSEAVEFTLDGSSCSAVSAAVEKAHLQVRVSAASVLESTINTLHRDHQKPG